MKGKDDLLSLSFLMKEPMDHLPAQRPQPAPNKHGRCIKPRLQRKGRPTIPMHIMATYALLQLPDHEDTLRDMCAKIEENTFFYKHLDWRPKAGHKTNPRSVASRHLTAAAPVPIRIMLFVSIASVLVVLPGYLQHGAVRCPGRAASCNRHHAHPRPQPMRYYGTGAD